MEGDVPAVVADGGVVALVVPTVPEVEDEPSLISPVTRSLRKICWKPVVTPSMRLVEPDSKATYLPSELSDGKPA